MSAPIILCYLVIEKVRKVALELFVSKDAIDKGTFRTLPRQDAPHSVAKVLHVAQDPASGLADLHSAGFLRYDISGGEDTLAYFCINICMRIFLF